MTEPTGSDRLTDAKELVRLERQIAKVEAILAQLETRRAMILATLSKGKP